MTHPHRTLSRRRSTSQAVGATLTALASSSDDRDCIDVFANALDVGTEAKGPLLLTVLVEPLASSTLASLFRLPEIRMAGSIYAHRPLT